MMWVIELKDGERVYYDDKEVVSVKRIKTWGEMTPQEREDHIKKNTDIRRIPG
jgi:hypothetical protein